MFSSSIRSVLRARTVQVPRVSPVRFVKQMTPVRFYSAHHEETFEEFTKRYV